MSVETTAVFDSLMLMMELLSVEESSSSSKSMVVTGNILKSIVELVLSMDETKAGEMTGMLAEFVSSEEDAPTA